MVRLTGLSNGHLGSAVSHARWWLPLVIAVIAGIIRFWNLGHPDQLIFDETYYVKDAYSLFHFGYEREWPKDVNEAFADGTAEPLSSSEYVVHPPLGKWMIAAGMAIFGTDTGLGWRAASAFAGTLAAVFTTLAATRLFRSTIWGGLAGLFVAVDGQQIALSRTGILDIFYFMFITLATWLVLVDRDHGRRRLVLELTRHNHTKNSTHDAWAGLGPRLWFRPWQLALGVSLGGLCAVKWSGITFVAVFGLLVVWWDCQARRSAGIQRWLAGGVLRNGVPAFLTIVPTTALTYVATWLPWMLQPQAWGHGLAAKEGSRFAQTLPGAFGDLLAYHGKAYAFHTGLTKDHGWASNPWTWPLSGRPTLFLWDTTKRDGVPCASDQQCVQIVTDLPNPLLWWAGTVAILVVLWAFLGTRDPAALAILAGVVAGYVPWLFYPERTMFFFYTTGFQLSWILAVIYVLRLIGQPRPRPGLAGTPAGISHFAGMGRTPREVLPASAGWAGVRNSKQRAVGVAVFVFLVLLVSAFFLPIVTGETLFSNHATWRIWLPSWT